MDSFVVKQSLENKPGELFENPFNSQIIFMM